MPVQSGGAFERRFYLAADSTLDRPKLRDDEMQHALRVLRLQPGDRLIGLDGRGAAFPLEIRAVARRTIELVHCGEPRRQARPGEPGAPLPWIEIAVALPRAGRAEEMLDRLIQIGVAAITPLVAERTGPAGRMSGHRIERLQRVAMEACKQCGRSWLPAIRPECTTRELFADRHPRDLLLFDPRASSGVSQWIANRPTKAADAWTEAAPLVLAIGPEGGFTPDEEQAFEERGAKSLRLGPHTLRIETAAECALAILVDAFYGGNCFPSAIKEPRS